MGIKSGYSHEKLNYTLKGLGGVPSRPSRRHAMPSQKQVETVLGLVEKIESYGCPVRFRIEEDNMWKRDSTVTYCLIRDLLVKLHDLELRDTPGEWRFVNLCRNTMTGKKIKYITKTKGGFPFGYELIGQLEVRFIPADGSAGSDGGVIHG